MYGGRSLATDPIETHNGSLAFEAIGMTFPDGTEALREISFPWEEANS